MLDKFDLDFHKYENIRTDEARFSKPLEKITDPVPLLFQSGYLAIKDYDWEDESFSLSYPNNEVRKAMQIICSDKRTVKPLSTESGDLR